MRVLLDTHLLLWATGAPDRLPSVVRDILTDQDNEPLFSTVSIWEVAIKRALGKPGFRTDPRLVRDTLRQKGYCELDMTGDHAVAVDKLPLLHKDPFDRILIAQASVEGVSLLTSDTVMAGYAEPVRMV